MNCITPSVVETEVSLEQFIPDHVFIYATAGSIRCYDGDKSYTFKAGEFFLARKNRLARYYVEKGGGEFERMIFCYEESLLREFQQKHKIEADRFNPEDTFIKIKPTVLIPDFIHSLRPYCDSTGKIDEAFENLKYEELLIILLQDQPELAGLLFDFARPEKINLEEFMNRNYKFNVSVERFAYLTGRSLSAFKRDFKMIFNQTPNRWLIQKRLQEAYFLIGKKGEKASKIYLELGFEALSHFSYAFKKLFGLTPTELAEQYYNN
ncbi:helix-turn-helix domain-containing protein [Mucilaginibacter sp.]